MTRRSRHAPSEMGQFLSGKFSTAILRYPTGRYGIAGSVPAVLTDENQRSLVWDTEQGVIDALVGIGVTRFQLADCTWYAGKP